MCCTGDNRSACTFLFSIQSTHTSFSFSEEKKNSTTQREVSVILHQIISYPRHTIVTESVTNCQTTKTIRSGFICLHPPIEVFQHAGWIIYITSLRSTLQTKIIALIERSFLLVIGPKNHKPIFCWYRKPSVCQDIQLPEDGYYNGRFVRLFARNQRVHERSLMKFLHHTDSCISWQASSSWRTVNILRRDETYSL